jgi:hypothetical protein
MSAVVALTVLRGSFRTIIGVVILVVLLKTPKIPIQEFVSLWGTNSRIDAFFAFVGRTSFIDLVVVFFFVFFLLSFAMGCIKLFSFNTNETKGKKKDESSKNVPRC